MLMLKSQTAWVELKPHVHRETAWSALGRGKRKADGAGTGCKGEGGLEGGGGGGGFGSQASAAGEMLCTQ